MTALFALHKLRKNHILGADHLYHESKQVMRLEEISKNLEEEQQTNVLHCLKDLSNEGLISRMFKDRVPYYTML